MASREPDVAAADVGGAANELRQRFVVPFEYPVVFTEDAFAPANPVLRDALARVRAGAAAPRVRGARRAACATRGPDLAARSRRYAEAHAATIELVGDPSSSPAASRRRTTPAVVSELPPALRRPPARSPRVRRRDRRRRGARRRRLRRGDRASRGPRRAPADDGARAERLRRRREERRQRVRHQELPRHVRAAVRGDQRRALPRDASPGATAIAGMAEAVKVALIRDAAFFDWLEAHADALAALRARRARGR